MPPDRLSGALAAILAACPDADRSASIAAITGGHATHKLCQPAAKLPESGMAGFAAGLAPEPVSTLAGFEVTRRKCRQTVSRWMPSSCAIRRWTSQGGNRASCFGNDREVCRGSQVMVLLSRIGPNARAPMSSRLHHPRPRWQF